MHKFSTTATLFSLHEVASKLEVPFETLLLSGNLEAPIFDTKLWKVFAKVSANPSSKDAPYQCQLVANIYDPLGRFIKGKEVVNLEDINEFIEQHMAMLHSSKKVTFSIDKSVSASRMGQPCGEAKFHGMKIDDIVVHHITMDKEFVTTGFVKDVDFDEFSKLPGIKILESFEAMQGIDQESVALPEIKPQSKYAITTIDSDYNEDSVIITTDKDLNSMNEEELVKTLGDVMTISLDDRIVVVNLDTTQELTL